ncbi:MAG: UTP--glucose-1-phosphate uridylyltransferase [Simkaniaceae bacterium]|nr:UTP--glucose-1-phosphate uridylyltransferase [Simkaniaceae bacterium]
MPQPNLSHLLSKITSLKSHAKKLEVLNFEVEHIEKYYPDQLEEQYLLKSLIAIGQESVMKPYFTSKDRLNHLLNVLKNLDRFYGDFGGIIGYQAEVLNLLNGKKDQDAMECFPPESIDIRQETADICGYMIDGIRQMGQLCEMYAIGGAADRLNLVDEKTGVDLPAAKLKIMRHTLLEYLVRDLFAREYLHYRLFNEQLQTAIAMMTSVEKDNDFHVKTICSSQDWFGRGEENFIFFCQPLVPTFNQHGVWVAQEDGELLLKPGGHGVIWKLALQEKVIERLKKRGYRKVLIRQINNPIAGIDYGLAAFLGIGLSRDQMFGFASCPRRKNAREGVNVLKKRMHEGKEKWALSNIEYCDIRSESIESDDYPANTNILFADLNGIEEAVKKNPFPGVLLNFKAGDRLTDQSIARLELTMQNIADFFEDESRKHSKSYLTLNHRHKTISVAKKAFVADSSFLETPEGCFIDMQKEAHMLLSSCKMTLPSIEGFEENLFKELPFLIAYHPALGPFYSIIRQKIRGGSMERGSELRLEIAEIKMEDVSIRGSLIIETDAILGHKERGKIVFSNRAGRAVLKNVKIENRGIDFSHKQNWVRGEVVHNQQCMISIGENAEFIAQDVELKGDLIIRVPNNTRCRAVQINKKLEFQFQPIDEAIPLYTYRIGSNHEIILESA